VLKLATLKINNGHSKFYGPAPWTFFDRRKFDLNFIFSFKIEIPKKSIFSAKTLSLSLTTTGKQNKLILPLTRQGHFCSGHSYKNFLRSYVTPFLNNRER
jgi:hypothetical protein